MPEDWPRVESDEWFGVQRRCHRAYIRLGLGGIRLQLISVVIVW